MTADAKKTAGEVLTRVAEEFAFMFSEPGAYNPSTAVPENLRQVSMRFDGPCRGRFCLAAPQSLAIEAAGNALGVNEENSSVALSGADDVLCELLNIVCGQFLTAYSGKDSAFNLSIPDVTACSVEDWKRLAENKQTSYLLLEDNPLLLCVEIEGKDA